MVNRCSQTEEPSCQYLMPVSDQKSHTFDNFGDIDRRMVYNVPNTNQTKSHEKSHSTSGNHEKGKLTCALFIFLFFLGSCY